MKRVLALHIRHLAREHGITIHWLDDGDERGHAKVNDREVWIDRLVGDDEMKYWVALHEIGHVMVGLHETRLKREAAAWKWAYENALMNPSFDIRQRVCANLVRYIFRQNNHNDWGPLPEDDHYFWDLIRWWDIKDQPLGDN